MRRQGISRWAIALIAAAVGLSFGESARAQAVTSAEVATAVQRGIQFLKTAPLPQGWNNPNAYHAYGQIELAALALVNAGVPNDDPALAKLLEIVERLPNTYTYTTALKIQVLAAADPKKYNAAISQAAEALYDGQTNGGMWTYSCGKARGGLRMGGGDNSNTQFGLLGLHEAAKAGLAIPATVWERSKDHFTNTQLQSGGWAYSGGGGQGRGTGSMTAAGVASLYICGQRLMTGGQKTFNNNGVYPSCGKYLTNLPLAEGLGWLAKNFSGVENMPARVAPAARPAALHNLYYMYALERVGMISGLRNFGEHDWYREGAASLVSRQSPQGSWQGSYGPLADTSFALLFLAKGNRPVLYQKVEWNGPDGKGGKWNRNIHDLENLTAFIGDKLGKPTTWQTTNLAGTVQELRQSPLLLITGHEFPSFTDAEAAKLRQFTDTGGALLFEACCGSDAFRKGFQDFAKKVWPEYSCQPLSREHEVFSSLFSITDDTYGLQGINAGCRTSVFFSPHSLSALWELHDIKKVQINGGPMASSEKAYQIGANIAAYATGKNQLRNKLDVVELPEAAKAPPGPAEVPRGAVRIARLRYDGEFNADIHATMHMAAALRDKAKIDVVAQERQIDATDPKLYDYPILFITGHREFTLSAAEIKALAEYLSRGGFLIADTCCGERTDKDGKPTGFAKSFRHLAKQLFPEQDLTALAAEHPIYTGKAGVPLGEIKYRQVLAEQLKSRGTTQPPLEAIMLKGRTAVLYSKWDFTCAYEGDNPFSCYGYIDADGQKLGLNILLYAISY